jgi:DNA-binding Lrp family transcriptional regulator
VEERLAEALKLPSPVGQDLEKRILMVLAYNPQGLRINALGQGVGLGWRHIADLVEQLVAQGKIRKEEDRYFFNMD